MFTTAPLFGRFHSPLARAARPLRQPRPLHHLESLCADWIDPRLLDTPEEQRERIYTPKLTFLAFLDQALHPGSSCRDAVRQIQAYYQSLRPSPRIDSDTSAYCQARLRLQLPQLVLLRRHLAEHSGLDPLPFFVPGDHCFKVVDGTCLNLPDTQANRLAYPQSEDQKPGCGFPLLRLVGVFSLRTGALLERQSGPYKASEQALYQQLWPAFKPGDIILSDRNFCSWVPVAFLKVNDIDSLSRLHASRNADFRQGKHLGPNDRLVTLAKPQKRPANLSEAQWEQLPATLTVRLVRFRVPTQNGRSKKIILMTTLLDPVLWPTELLAAL